MIGLRVNSMRSTVREPVRAVCGAALAAFLFATSAPALAQAAPNPDGEARLRKLEAEVRALQRQVFPGGDGKYFAPQVTAPTAPTQAPGAPATTPVSDLLTRMDSVEAQIARLTAQSEETANRVAQIEAKMAAAAAAAAAPPAAVADPAAALAPAPAPAAPAAAAAAVSAAPAALAAAPPKAATGAATKPTAAKPTASAKPSPQRVAAVQKIEKPETGNPGDDEYSYGFRLWEAKFYPEAQQQLRLYVDKYPKDPKISYGRNLLGRAFLDDGKPRDAAPWFLQNYQADKRGARAADSLLMLAEAMRQLGDGNRGCIALAEFSANYAAEAAGRLRAQYEATRSALKCQ
jgi:TolA-binding protein